MHNFNVELRDDYKNKKYSIDELLNIYDFEKNKSDYKSIFSIICHNGNKDDFETFFKYKVFQSILIEILIKKGKHDFVKNNFDNYAVQFENNKRVSLNYLFGYYNLKQILDHDNLLFLFENYYNKIDFCYEVDTFIIENKNKDLFKLIQNNNYFSKYPLHFKNIEDFDFIMENLTSENKIKFLLKYEDKINKNKFDFINFLSHQEILEINKNTKEKSWFNEQIKDYLLKNELNKQLDEDIENSITKSKRKI